MFIRPRDCIGHESNCTLSGPQSSGVMRHKIDATRRSCDASGTQARNVATTFRRSEETYIDDTQRCHEVRAENAPKVAEDNAKIQRLSQGVKKCETCEAAWTNHFHINKNRSLGRKGMFLSATSPR